MLGEVAALAAAFFWALASLLYGRFSHHFSALQLNLVKGVIAASLMLLTLPLLPNVEFSLSPEHIGILLFSGVIGIAIGDSAYFASLKRIGVNKTLLLESIAPPLSGILAVLILGSLLTWQSWLGVLVTTFAVALVVMQPETHTQKVNAAGIGFGLLASVCQASGVVISHYALVAGDIEPLLGAVLRLLAGVGALLVTLLLFKRRQLAQLVTGFSKMAQREFVLLLLAIVVGTFLTLWLQQIALKYANPAVAQTLIATSPLFILLFSILKGQIPSGKTLFGTVLAVGGISLFFIFR
ncbi:EamA-like transporter family protein [Pseudoalteromonas sp. P1-9]|uniref:DMT family transporter n=1 Tax=Pseudoalteromonas sp. P1-9 TaxID=1710354 RepID=UPI0006D62F2F|nr:DMT family transporter [Pseudoalteromonas sp. P1-9]KPV96803.1 EamA-like transporter family protein [Pseudoalteromonas sp. P1-9]